MTEENGPEDEGENQGGGLGRLSLDAFMERMIEPIPLDTKGLGRIYIRPMTATMSATLATRMRGAEVLGNRDIARIFMGSTCTHGEGEGENFKVGYKPLPQEDVDLLAVEDVENFTSLYVLRVLKKPGLDTFGIVAEHAKNEAKRAEESAQKMAGLLANMAKSSAVMTNWPDMRKVLEPSTRLGDVLGQFKMGLGGSSDIGKTIQDVLGSVASGRLGSTVPGVESSTNEKVTFVGMGPSVDPIRLVPPTSNEGDPQLISLSAIERLASKVSGDVEGMVVHVGEMSGDLKEIAELTRTQVEGARISASRAFVLALLAVIVTILVPAISRWADSGDRADQAQRDEDMVRYLESQVELLGEQNSRLRELIEISENQSNLTNRVIEQNTELARRASDAKAGTNKGSVADGGRPSQSKVPPTRESTANGRTGN